MDYEYEKYELAREAYMEKTYGALDWPEEVDWDEIAAEFGKES